MSLWTEEELTAHIALYKKACADLATAESVTLDDGTTLRRSQLGEVRAQLKYYEGELARVQGTGGLTMLHFGSVR